MRIVHTCADGSIYLLSSDGRSWRLIHTDKLKRFVPDPEIEAWTRIYEKHNAQLDEAKN